MPPASPVRQHCFRLRRRLRVDVGPLEHLADGALAAGVAQATGLRAKADERIIDPARKQVALPDRLQARGELHAQNRQLSDGRRRALVFAVRSRDGKFE